MTTTSTLLSNDGTSLPRLAFGTATCYIEQDCSDQLVEALNRGFRHLDTAEEYQNEDSIGLALKKWAGNRESVFITTKFGREDLSAQDPRESLQRSLKRMGVSYVDMYLIHDPIWIDEHHRLSDIWKVMEELRAEGLARSIGVSNFLEHHMEEIAPHWKVVPCVNQVEVSPFCAHDEKHQGIVRSSAKYGVPMSAYTTLAPLFRLIHPPMTNLIKQIGKTRGITDAQVLLAWALQVTDGPLVTITRNPQRCDEYLEGLKYTLLPEEVERISAVGKEVSFRRFS